jgi:hypothetical protein
VQLAAVEGDAGGTAPVAWHVRHEEKEKEMKSENEPRRRRKIHADKIRNIERKKHSKNET